MRNAFAAAVTELGDQHPELVMLAGDIGNRLFDGFKERHPDRFYNCGVAEANMTGVAAGLAASGLRPVTYTITPFNTVRCLEQIRLDVCYPDLPVIIVGTGAGLSYAELGATHHSMEDIAILRTLPNMHVVCPADPVEVKLALADALRIGRPTYIRLGKKGEPKIHATLPAFEIGCGITMRTGNDVAILSVGNMLATALETADALAAKHCLADVVSLHTVKPLDDALLASAFADRKLVVVLEEHGLAGGAGSAVLEWGSARRVDLRKLLCLGGPDRFLSSCGDQQEARAAVGLDAAAIAARVLDLLG
ncbi:transketolase [Burkholderia sp. WAC0059]|uniref:transketolase family protein n=1 Tax=Burkholderia sp. WAC0059 TaxID=2066022 RepID=UPI000C7F108A|nr:transketolase C-terminal domain-containing protein [Burkholderia sp. WAC0059]PLZ01921.1 transketolase [Burkholderia sp. WAC0059]